MLFRNIALTSTLAALMAWSQSAYGQTSGAATVESPCRVSPDAESSEGSLTDRLDDCNGVLKPPIVGDPGIVQQAPDVGEMPVIPPGSLPQQQSQDNSEGTEPGAEARPAGYSAGQIVDAIGMAADTADKLGSLDVQQIDIYDISILLEGVDAAVINTSLSVHKHEVEMLQNEIAHSDRVMDALRSKGLTPVGVVAVEIDASGAVTVFAR
jgi:hypothetical protein